MSASFARSSSGSRPTAPPWGAGILWPSRRRALARLRTFYDDAVRTLDGVDFDQLGLEGRVDSVLLRVRLAYERRLLEREAGWFEATAALLPFAATITGLHDARFAHETLDPVKAATTLDGLARAVDEARSALPNGAAHSSGGSSPASNGGSASGRSPRLIAFRAQEQLSELSDTLKSWFEFHRDYDPLFTWWCEAPYKEAAKALDTYRTALREKGVGMTSGDEEPIVGSPVGREALIADLRSELVPYTPEELIAIAGRELAWCDAEMKKAAAEMGVSNLKDAVEAVKARHVEPGRQPDLIRDLAREAEAYVEQHDLVTVPPLAKEIWRMTMLSPERQKVNPFFLGGEVIQVSFPTAAMEHDDKQMSLRGNNRHFARATVHHELIPGHHLQQFMNARHQTHRRAFNTPFWMRGLGAVLGDAAVGSRASRARPRTVSACCSGGCTARHASSFRCDFTSASERRASASICSSIAWATSGRTPRPKCGGRSTGPIRRCISSRT